MEWTLKEERSLINFISGHKAEAGAGASFKQATWNQAATHMYTQHPNLIFSAAQCAGKWGRVCQLSAFITVPLTNGYATA